MRDSAEPNIVYEGSRFRVERLRYRAGDADITRDVIRHPGAVTIIPLVDDDHVCLIRNFRPSVAQTLIELPAGTLEPGEDPRISAERELAEETGYQARHWELLHEFFLSPGVLDEKMRLYVARDLSAGAPHREVNEQIENHIVRWGDAMDMLRRGEIRDAKTIVGLMLFDQRRA